MQLIKIQKFIKSLAIAACYLAVNSCQIGPKHFVPIVDFPNEWDAEKSASSGENPLAPSEPLGLEDLLEDPLLPHYYKLLAAHNHNVRIARAKIQEAYALRQASASQLYPFIDGNILYNRSFPAGGVLTGGQSLTGTSAATPTSNIPFNLKEQNFLAEFDLNWEIDLFGKIQSRVDSSTAHIGAEIASYRDILVSLTSEFARTYLELRRNQIKLKLLKKEFQAQEAINNASKERFHKGLDDESAYLDSQASLNTLKLQIPLAEGRILSLIYNLSYLIGKHPSALANELNKPAALPEMRQNIPVGFPSSLLRRRPDIRIAERQLAEAAADVRTAAAGLLPDITLTGSYGFENLHLGASKGQGESWSYAAQLLEPIFHGGGLLANLHASEQERAQAIIAYEQTVLQALQETESAIALYIKSLSSLEGQEIVFKARSKQLAHAGQQYRQGLAGSIQFYKMELDAIAAEIDWINSKADAEINLIALYKSLGGEKITP